jgi:arsenite-transporting ATPase
LRRSYESRIDRVFEGLMGRNLDASHDRRILRELLSLAPPGIDEVYALALLGETLAEGRFAAIVVDPAPTGHLLRLLEMPALALEWSHRLMRLMLKYREVGGLGDAAEEVLAFARRTKAVGQLLTDASRAAVLVVALDEPLVRAETLRLIAAVRALQIDVAGVLWNRTKADPAALPTEAAADQFVAPALEPAPRGVEPLRQWHAHWSPLARSHG